MAAITAELKLEIGKFRKGILSAKSATSSLARGAGSAGKRIAKNLFGGAAAAAKLFAKSAKIAMAAVAAAGIAAAGAITAGLKKAFDLGGRLSDVAARIGDSAGNAQILETMFAQAGVSAEKMAPSLQKMQRAIIEARDRGGTLAEPFDELGLSIENLAGMGGVDAFNAIATAIGGLDNAAERTARAMQIFGRSGGELLTLFSDPAALAKAQSMVGGQADILSRAAGDFDRASDIWGGLSSKVTGLFVGMGEDMISHFLPALEALNKIDLAPIGQRLGKSLSDAVFFFRAAWDTLSSADLGELIKDSLILGMKESVNVLWKGLQATIAATVRYIAEGFITTVKIFEVMGRKDFWKGVGEALKGAAAGFASVILSSVATLMDSLSKIKGLGGLSDVAKSAREKATGFSAIARDSGSNGANILAPVVDEVRKRLIDAGKATASSFTDTYRDARDIISTDGERNRIAAKADAIKQRAAEMRKPKGEAAAEAAKSPGGIPAPGDVAPGSLSKSAPAIIASSLAKIGGGGRVAFQDTAARAAQQQVSIQRKMEGHLKKIAGETQSKNDFIAIMGG